MNASEAEELSSILRRARERNRAYLAPPLDELQQATGAAQSLLRAVTSLRDYHAIPSFKGAHFELVPTQLGGAPAVAVREDATHHRGGGVYVFRLGAIARERLIQVPHSFFDVGTLEIGMELASVAQARALFVNTVHRYQGGKVPAGDEDESEGAVADLAHQELTFFQNLTLTALTTLPQVQIIQIHGFADGGVPDRPQAAVVVSAGVAPAGAAEAGKVAARLGALFGKERVLLFPRDTRRFGARRNVQGRAVAATGHGSFLHIELSRSMRTQLNSDAGLRRAFAAAVIGEEAGIP